MLLGVLKYRRHRPHAREVILLIGNRFDPDRVPLFDPFFDFFGYGGVYRAIEWPSSCPALRVHSPGSGSVTLDLSGPGGRLIVEVEDQAALPDTVDLHTAFDEGNASTFACVLLWKTGACAFRTEVPVIAAGLVTADSPHLHKVKVVIGGDSII